MATRTSGCWIAALVLFTVGAGRIESSIAAPDVAPCECAAWQHDEIPMLNTPVTCEMPRPRPQEPESMPSFTYVIGPTPGTGSVRPGRCQRGTNCVQPPKVCSWPSYTVRVVAAPCAGTAYPDGPFTVRGPGGTVIGQPFGPGESSPGVVCSPSAKACGSTSETLNVDVEDAMLRVLTRVVVITACRGCEARP